VPHRLFHVARQKSPPRGSQRQRQAVARSARLWDITTHIEVEPVPESHAAPLSPRQTTRRPSKASPWSTALIGRQKAYLQRRTQPPGAARSTPTARTAHHGHDGVDERLDLANSSAAICPETARRPLRRHMYLALLGLWPVPFLNDRLWLTLHLALHAHHLCTPCLSRGDNTRICKPSKRPPRAPISPTPRRLAKRAPPWLQLLSRLLLLFAPSPPTLCPSPSSPRFAGSLFPPTRL
jgi:hypothetical protein